MEATEETQVCCDDTGTFPICSRPLPLALLPALTGVPIPFPCSLLLPLLLPSSRSGPEPGERSQPPQVDWPLGTLSKASRYTCQVDALSVTWQQSLTRSQVSRISAGDSPQLLNRS